MIDKVIYKCVVFASTHEVEQQGSHYFAWKSAILEVLGDTDPGSLPPDLFDVFMSNNPEAMQDFNTPDYTGVSVWRGTLSIKLGDDVDLFVGVNTHPTFAGQWKELTRYDWGFLKDRDMENLVELNRFPVLW